MAGLLAAWFAEIAIITYRGFERKSTVPVPIQGLPLPADYVGATVLFGGLGLLGRTQAQGVATLVGWGLVVATLLNLWTPSSGKVKPGTTAKSGVTPS